MMRPHTAKKLLCLLLSVCIGAAFLAVPAAASDGTLRTVPARQYLVIDGEERRGVEIYNINDETYYRLRDMAMLLGGTPAEFGVSYEEATRSISVTRGAEYLPVGGELAAGADRSASCVPSNQTLLIDGTETGLRAYNLGGTNFFRLRDLGPVLGFDVDYDAQRSAVLVDTHSAVSRIRLGASEYFLTLPTDASPLETGGYVCGESGMTLDVYELSGVADLRALAEADAAKAAAGETPAVAAAPVPGLDALCYAAENELVCYLNAGSGLCEKLVFSFDGAGSEAAEDILRTLEKPLRVMLGGGPLSLYLPEAFAFGAQPERGAYADAGAGRFVDVRYDGDVQDFDLYVSALGKTRGGEDGPAQSLSLITKYYIIDSVPDALSEYGASCCMLCAIRLGDGAATVAFWANNANFGWARRILRTLGAE